MLTTCAARKRGISNKAAQVAYSSEKTTKLSGKATMRHGDTLTVTLSHEIADAVDDAVETGEYDSADEAIGDALREWKERRENFGYTVEELRAEIQKGILSGPSNFTTIEEIKAEARRRVKERQDNFGYTLEQLRALWREGVESGESEPAEAFLDELLASDAAKAAQR